MPGAIFRTKLAVGGLSTDVLTLSRPGTNLVGAGTARYYLPFHFIVQQVRCSLGTPALGTAMTVDVNYNGTTILAPAKVTVGIGAFQGAAVVPAITSLNADGYLTIDVDAVGSSAANLTVSILGYWSEV